MTLPLVGTPVVLPVTVKLPVFSPALIAGAVLSPVLPTGQTAVSRFILTVQPVLPGASKPPLAVPFGVIVKVTMPPPTGSLWLLVTVRASGVVKSVVTVALPPLPTRPVKAKPCDSKAPLSHDATCGRVTPRASVARRWVVVGSVGQAPVSIAGEPGSRATVWVGPP